MKIQYLFILAIMTFVCHPNNSTLKTELFNKALYEKAEVVLRGIRIGESGPADKYRWDKFKIIETYKNNSKIPFSGELLVASFSWEKGIPEKECTIYLEKYNNENNTNWKLLGGKAETGVSNIKN